MTIDWTLLALRLLAILLLYSFVGVAFYIIWRDVQEMARRAEPPPPESETPAEKG